MATEKSVSITGKIQITDKIYFEYYQLYKPDKRELKYYHNSVRINNQLQIEYLKDKKEYEASKQLIEVENKTYPVIIKDNEYWILLEKSWNICKDSQPCTAQIKDNKAIIISLNK